MNDSDWMRLALQQAKQAEIENEVPVGAVVVFEDECIAEAYNQPILRNDPTAHAEILVMRKAGGLLGNYRLVGCTLYVTLEPCAMCVGAMIHARIKRLVYAASDPKTGAVDSAIKLLSHEMHNHRFEVTSGVCEADASEMLKGFFRLRR